MDDLVVVAMRGAALDRMDTVRAAQMVQLVEGTITLLLLRRIMLRVAKDVLRLSRLLQRAKLLCRSSSY
jgi:hypothetical protein